MERTEFAAFRRRELEPGALEEEFEDGGLVEERGHEGLSVGLFEEGRREAGEGCVDEWGGGREGEETWVGCYCGAGEENAGFGTGAGNGGVLVGVGG